MSRLNDHSKPTFLVVKIADAVVFNCCTFVPLIRIETKEIFMLNALMIFSCLLVMGNTGLGESQVDKPKDEINLDLIETKHFVTSHDSDSLFYINSGENKKLGWSATSIFISKIRDETKPISYFYKEFSFIVKYSIIDLDNDGVNEVVCFDMDEAYFSMTIYRAKFIDSNFVIEKSFYKKPLYIPNIDIPGVEFEVLKVLTDTHNNKKLRLYYGMDNQKIKYYEVFYDKRKQRFVEK
jgi:hypothetical protein